MKKTALLLITTTLLCTLTACSPSKPIREPIESEDGTTAVFQTDPPPTNRETASPTLGETDATTPPAITAHPNDEGYRLTFGIKEGDVGYYDSVMLEELRARYSPAGYIYSGSAAPTINTPTGILFASYHTNAFYDKQTGNMSRACPDSGCTHTDCAWGKLDRILYISEEHIYFLSRNRQTYRLYRSDLAREHVELLIENYPINDLIKYVRDGMLYIQEMQIRDGQAPTNRFVAWNSETRKKTVLSEEIPDLEILAVYGDTVIYRAGRLETAPVYRTDLDFSESEEILQDVDYVQVYQYNEKYLIVLGVNDTVTSYQPEFVYELETGKRIGLPHTSSSLNLDGRYIYYLKNISEEEILTSPLKDYYQYEVDNPKEDFPYRCRNMDAGRIFRMDLETGQEELVMEITYNGVPIRISDFTVDGKVIYVSYWTYKDYNNYYNPDYCDENGFITQAEDQSYLLYDLSNGTVSLLNPYRTD